MNSPSEFRGFADRHPVWKSTYVGPRPVGKFLPGVSVESPATGGRRSRRTGPRGFRRGQGLRGSPGRSTNPRAMPSRTPLNRGLRQTNGSTANSGTLQNMCWICSNSGAVWLNSVAGLPAAESQAQRNRLDNQGDGDGPGRGRARMQIADEDVQSLYDALGRWHVSSDVTADLQGLLTDDEIAEAMPLLAGTTVLTAFR